MTKPRIAVIGAGLMGHGIAQVFGLAGHDVAITDSYAPTLASAKDRILANLTDLGDDVAALERIRVSASLAEAVAEADFIVEAVREDLGVKQQLFAEIERAARGDAVLASNTSVIPITAIMGKLENRARALGTHWWNPPYLVPLVEVIATEWTTPAAIDFTMKLHADVGKTPVHVKKDVPGFVGNRLQHALKREAIAIVADGICTGYASGGRWAEEYLITKGRLGSCAQERATSCSAEFACSHLRSEGDSLHPFTIEVLLGLPPGGCEHGARMVPSDSGQCPVASCGQHHLGHLRRIFHARPVAARCAACFHVGVWNDRRNLWAQEPAHGAGSVAGCRMPC